MKHFLLLLYAVFLCGIEHGAGAQQTYHVTMSVNGEAKEPLGRSLDASCIPEDVSADDVARQIAEQFGSKLQQALQQQGSSQSPDVGTDGGSTGGITYFEEDGRCYFAKLAAKTNFSTAESYCSEHNASLANIYSERHHESAVRLLCYEAKNASVANMGIWTGMRWNASEKSLTYSNGSPTTEWFYAQKQHEDQEKWNDTRIMIQTCNWCCGYNFIFTTKQAAYGVLCETACHNLKGKGIKLTDQTVSRCVNKSSYDEGLCPVTYGSSCFFGVFYEFRNLTYDRAVQECRKKSNSSTPANIYSDEHRINLSNYARTHFKSCDVEALLFLGMNYNNTDTTLTFPNGTDLKYEVLETNVSNNVTRVVLEVRIRNPLYKTGVKISNATYAKGVLCEYQKEMS